MIINIFRFLSTLEGKTNFRIFSKSTEASLNIYSYNSIDDISNGIL